MCAENHYKGTVARTALQSGVKLHPEKNYCFLGNTQTADNSNSVDPSIMNEIILPPYTPETVVVHTHNEHKKTLTGDKDEMSWKETRWGEMRDMMEQEKRQEMTRDNKRDKRREETN